MDNLAQVPRLGGRRSRRYDVGQCIGRVQAHIKGRSVEVVLDQAQRLAGSQGSGSGIRDDQEAAVLNQRVLVWSPTHIARGDQRVLLRRVQVILEDVGRTGEELNPAVKGGVAVVFNPCGADAVATRD